MAKMSKKKVYCLECFTEITEDTEVCPGCDCSIDGIVDAEGLGLACGCSE